MSRIVALAFAAAAIASCRDGSGNGGSPGPAAVNPELRISAASELPTDIIASAEVTIASIDVVPVDSGTNAVSLLDGPQTIDVAALSGGGSARILVALVPGGTFGQARVAFSGPARIRLVDGRTFEPTPSGGATVTVALAPPLVVAAGSTRVLLVLMDLAASFPITPSFALATAQVTGVGFTPSLKATSAPMSSSALTGEVFSSKGEPVAGAHVGVKQGAVVRATTTTEKDGSFAFPGPALAQSDLEVDAPGFAPTRLSLDGAAPGGTGFVGVRLNVACGCGSGCQCSGYRGCGCGFCGSRPSDSTGTIQGTVTNSTSGAPVAGASVRAIANGATAGTATTTDQGAFAISGLAAGLYDVAVSAPQLAPGLTPGQRVKPHEATTVPFRLEASR